METQPEAYDNIKLTRSLDVQPFLENYNKSLLTKYKSEEDALGHRVFELKDLDVLTLWCDLENAPSGAVLRRNERAHC